MKALVTGGGGFLGGAIARMLAARGGRVVSFSRGDYPALRSLGIETVRGDLGDADAVARACEGCDAVYHSAAQPGVWGPYELYYNANFVGTRNVVEACRTAGVGRLIYTSTPSVVFNGRDMKGADESAPYADHYESYYAATKALAERHVLEANSPELATVALRPHLIWGPGDNHLVPRIIARARQLRIVGDGTNIVDTVYVDNAAHAHVLAGERLAPGSAIAGRAYFVSQGEPIRLWEMVNLILAAGGKPPVTRHISARAAYAVGGAMEFVYRALGIKSEPRMTRFVARELATSHWFDISAARRDLGYEPLITTEEGLRRLAESLRGGAAKA